MKRACLPLFCLLVACSCRRMALLEHLSVRPARTAADEAAPTSSSQDKEFAEIEALVQENKLREARARLITLMEDDTCDRKRAAALLAQISQRSAREAEAAAKDTQIETELKAREKVEALLGASQRLSVAKRLVKTGHLDQAQAAVTPLLGQGILEDEAQALAEEIEWRRDDQTATAAATQTTRRAMMEVKERLALPERYGETIVISKTEEPLRLPPGPVEEMLSRKIPIKLERANVIQLFELIAKDGNIDFVVDGALLAKLEEEEEPAEIMINVGNVSLGELFSFIARNMGIAFHVGENMIWVTESDEPQGQGPKLQTRFFRLREGFIPAMGGGGGDGGGGGGGGDNELEDALEALLADGPDEAVHQVFRNRNLLVVKNTLENLRVVEELLESFDKQPMQVLIEARFVTISQTDLFELGVDIPELNMLPKDLDDRDSIASQTAKSTLAAFTKADSGGQLNLAGIIGNRAYQAVLHALDEKGTAQTLSAPRITVVNNQQATIRKGNTLYYFEEYDVQTVDRGSTAGTTVTENIVVPTGDPTELNLGVTLDVKVNIGNDGKTVMLALQPEITEFIRWISFRANPDDGDGGGGSGSVGAEVGTVSLPEVNENTLTTTVVVDSGETVVLGGMLTSLDTETITKVPFLGDIPYLGFLFRSKTRETKPEHLLIFVTAQIIDSAGRFVDYQEIPAAVDE